MVDRGSPVTFECTRGDHDDCHEPQCTCACHDEDDDDRRGIESLP